MKKETESSVKTASKPKGNEKKTSVKKKNNDVSDTPAITETQVTCHENEEVTNHAPDRLNSQSVPPSTSECLIADTDNSKKTNQFPIEVLPSRLQEIIREANATLGFPMDYMAGAMLSAMAAVIGNTHHAEAMAGWKEYAILFVALVGCPDRFTQRILAQEKVGFAGVLFSSEHNQTFRTERSVAKLERDPENEHRFILNIDGVSVFQWFRDMARKLLEKLGFRPKEPGKSHSYKI